MNLQEQTNRIKQMMGLNENDFNDARFNYNQELDNWNKELHKFTEKSWQDMFNHLKSLDMSHQEAWMLINTNEYKDKLKQEKEDWIQSHPKPQFTYDSGKEITKQQIIDVLVTALEGGSNYWYYIKDIPNEVESNDSKPLSEAIGEYILNDGEILIYDIEDEDELLGEVNMNKLLETITLLKQDYPEVYQNIINEDYDANDADIFFQLAVMGDVTFG